jgi:ribosomal protein L11 methyltransferase
MNAAVDSAAEEPRYPYVHVLTDADQADLLSTLLFGFGATGVEERDDTTYIKGPGDGRVVLVASFDDREEAEAAIASLREHDESIDASLHEVVGDAWRDAWKEHYEPFALTKRIWVRPPWKEAPPEAKLVLHLEPGRAFGTGLHATTSLVAGILDDCASEYQGKRLLDAGTGSGILSFVALLSGAANVVAFDVDPEAIDVVRENAERNGMASRLEVFAGTIDDVKGQFPWVVANIESRILMPIAEELIARVEPGGHLVLSGILLAEEGSMRERFESLSRKLELVEARRMETGGERAIDRDGWVSLHYHAVDRGAQPR